MPCLRHTSAADKPAACSFSTLMICSSVNLLLRMSVSRRNGLYPNSGTSTGSRSGGTHDYMLIPIGTRVVDRLPEYNSIEFKAVGRQLVWAGSIHPESK